MVLKVGNQKRALEEEKGTRTRRGEPLMTTLLAVKQLLEELGVNSGVIHLVIQTPNSTYEISFYEL
jgi:hypothetical protein